MRSARSFHRYGLVFLVALGAVGCEPAPAPPAPPPAPRIVVATTAAPMACLAQRIAGEHAEVVCPAPRAIGTGPWRPDEEALAIYGAADLVVITAARGGPWVSALGLDPARIVEVTGSPPDPRATESLGPGSTALDPCPWLDPVDAQMHADAILRALVDLLPAQAETLRANASALQTDLRGLHEGYLRMTPAVHVADLAAARPWYGSLARRYQWDIVTLGLDRDEDLTDERLEELRRRLSRFDDEHRQILLWDGAPEPALARVIERSIGPVSIVFDPGMSLEPGGDYVALMRANIARLTTALGLPDE